MVDGLNLQCAPTFQGYASEVGFLVCGMYGWDVEGHLRWGSKGKEVRSLGGALAEDTGTLCSLFSLSLPCHVVSSFLP